MAIKKGKVYLSLGHTIYKNGNISSADGVVNEYKYNKSLIKKVAKNLRAKGVDLDVITTPERKYSTDTQELEYKVNKEHAKKYICGIELHLNCYDKKARGAETLHHSSSKEGKKLATCIQKQLAKKYTDRGVKTNDKLYMLRHTRCPFVIVEPFFCDNRADCKVCNMDQLAKLISDGIYDYLDN